MDSDAIDLSKENIQPLRHGRKMHLLGLALQAETDCEVQQKLLKERDEYELNIRIYEGTDPLKPRYDYVLWLEQSYPKHGRESNLIPLLEDTITMFKDDDRYRQDIRFVELIIKFIDTQINPLELYQAVYNLGIGTMCAILYRFWAEELDSSGDLKRADKIYQLGISNHAEPIESLLQDHQQFQLSVGRRLLTGDELMASKEEKPPEKPRQILGKLRTKVGSSRPTFGKAGVVPLCLSNRNVPSKSNAAVSVYQDEEVDNAAVNTIENYQTKCLPKSDLAKKENSLKPGTWKKAYKPPRVHHVYTPSTPSFKVHEDNEPSTLKTPMSVCLSALKTRKGEDFQCPVAIFEPHDPSIKPMYCKSKIYVGGREFQFEEIQAALYYKKKREKLHTEEIEKLVSKVSNWSCLKTPQPPSKEAVDEPLTPQCKGGREEPKTPFIHGSKDFMTPCNSRLNPTTPYQQPHNFQPITPFDLPAQHFNEIVMDGMETIKKPVESAQRETLIPPKQSTKPTESTSNVKKFLNFNVYCDDD